MARRTAKITLGGEDYTIRAFNIGQLERVTDIIASANAAGKQGRITFDILRMALETAEPRIEDVNDLSPTMEEVTEAGRLILELAGIKVSRDPPKPQETGEA